MKQRRKETLIQGLKPNASLDGEFEAFYNTLTDRQRLIGLCLERAQSQRSMPPMGGGELLYKIDDFAVALVEIPDYALPECFRLAVIGHDVGVPFQVSEIIKIWREMSDTARGKLFKDHGLRALPSGPPCQWCDGRGWMRVKQSGKAVKWQSLAETNSMRRCWCKAGGEEPEDEDGEIIGLELVKPIDFKSAVRGLLNRLPQGGADNSVARARRRMLDRQAAFLKQNEQAYMPAEANPRDP